MLNNHIMIGLSSLAIAAGFGLAANVVHAQDTTDTKEEVTVVAHQKVTREVVGQSRSGMKEQLITLSEGVRYDDLDLTLHAGVVELEKRIESVAQDACEELREMYPLGEPSKSACVKEAIKSTNAQRDAVIAAATNN